MPQNHAERQKWLVQKNCNGNKMFINLCWRYKYHLLDNFKKARSNDFSNQTNPFGRKQLLKNITTRMR